MARKRHTTQLDGNCVVCGVDAQTHPRCRECEICVGEGHHERRVNAEGLCSSCAEVARKRREKAS